MHKRSIALAVSVTVAPVAAFAAPGDTITGRGIGAVKLGASYTDLKAAGRVGKPIVGCELAGPAKDAAKLKRPLGGTVSFSPDKVITNVTIYRGASVKGVGPGSTLAQVRSAFPNAKVRHSLESTFHLTEVRVSKHRGGPFTFGIDTDTGKTVSVGIPTIPLCD